MTNKRSMILGILLSLVIVTLMTFSLTYARYSDEVEPDGVISGDLEYIVSNEVEIKSVDEFFAAIENGYTNIKIDDSVDNPLIITGGVSDVNSDLTIDLNGHELIASIVVSGGMLVVRDGSEAQTGALHGPDGSFPVIAEGACAIEGGRFSAQPPADCLAEGFVAVEEDGTRDGVDAGVVVDDEAGVVVNLGTVEIVAPGELLQPAAVEVDAVEVGVVGVLFRVAAVSHEVDHARLLVHAQHFLHVPRSLGDAVEQGAVLGI